jgi:hypothetical protein
MIDAVNTLQFIDSMTGHLSWPLAAVVLGLIFRRSVVGLLGRVRRLRWRETEAELTELAEAKQGVQDAVAEAAKPLSGDAPEGEQQYRERIEELMRSSAVLGFRLGRFAYTSAMPEIEITWEDEFSGDDPRISLPLAEMKKKVDFDRFFGNHD